jgi:hypothetical protein
MKPMDESMDDFMGGSKFDGRITPEMAGGDGEETKAEVAGD